MLLLRFQSFVFARQAEFGRACLKTFLDGSSHPVHYIGLVKEKHFTDLRTAFESEIYNHWDNDTNLSPPKQRPPTATTRELDQQGLGLELIAMHGGHPVFPADVIMGKFRAGSPEQEGVKELQTKFEELYPPRNTSRSRPAATVQGANRATGHCDFSIENGEVPLDVTRILDVECVPIAEVPASPQRLLVSRKGLSVVVSCHVASMLPEQYFAECVLHDLLPCNVRLGVCVGKNGKPTVVIDQAHNIWLLNSSDETMDVTAGELFGFGTGAYTTIVDCHFTADIKFMARGLLCDIQSLKSLRSLARVASTKTR